MIEIITVVTLVTATGGLASVLASWFGRSLSKSREEPETLEQRIEKLTYALGESSKLVSEVEAEIQERHKLASELKQDAEKYETLITLNKDQVDAVAQVFQGELRREGTKSFWKGVAANFVFFLLGAAVSWFFSFGAI